MGNNLLMRFRPLPLVALVALAAACAPTPTAGSTVPTTSLSPASVTAATTATTAMSTSAGKVVDLGGSSVEFSTAAQINATAWLASDAKTFLVGQLELQQQDGNDCGVLRVSGYRVPDLINGDKFGIGTKPNCASGGGLILWGKIAGKWGVVVGGQAEPVCSDIRDAGWTSTIPKEFYGGQCMENGTDVIYKP